MSNNDSQKDMMRMNKILKNKNMDRFKKTKLCPRFQNGQCNRGSTCNFAHGQQELRKQVNLEKTKMCSEGQNCQRTHCSYAHDESELRFTDDCYKTHLCIQYQKGICKSGASCRYAHGEKELRKKSQNQQQRMALQQPYQPQMMPPMMPNPYLYYPQRMPPYPFYPQIQQPSFDEKQQRDPRIMQKVSQPQTPHLNNIDSIQVNSQHNFFDQQRIFLNQKEKNFLNSDQVFQKEQSKHFDYSPLKGTPPPPMPDQQDSKPQLNFTI